MELTRTYNFSIPALFFLHLLIARDSHMHHTFKGIYTKFRGDNGRISNVLYENIYIEVIIFNTFLPQYTAVRPQNIPFKFFSVLLLIN